jgi:hypothetical protein
MPSRFIIDVISGSGTRSGNAPGRGGTLILSSSVELAPTSFGASSTLYSSYIESYDIKGQFGTGLWLSGSAPVFFPGGGPKKSLVTIQGNLNLLGNTLNLSGSASPLSGSRGSEGETTHQISIASNVPAAGTPKGTSEGALVIKATKQGPPTSMMRFFTTTGDEMVQFAVPIAGSGFGGPPELEILSDTSIDGSLAVDGNLDAGNTTIDGDLTVLGNLTSIESQHLKIRDSVILLNSGAVGQDKSIVAFASGSTTKNPNGTLQSMGWGVNRATEGLGIFQNPRGDNTFIAFAFDAKDGNVSAGGADMSSQRWVGIASIAKTPGGQDFLRGTGTTNVSYSKGDGVWTINSSGGGGGGGGSGVFVDHGGLGNNPPLGVNYAHTTTSGSVLFNAHQGGTTRQLGDSGMINNGVGTNVVFYVSGTLSKPPTPSAINPGLSVATSGSVLLPDLHLSGALLGTGRTFGFENLSNVLQMRGQFVGITDVNGSIFRSGKDNFFFVTGSSTGAFHVSGGDPDQGNPGSGNSFAISTVFAGDVITSGSLHLHEAPSRRSRGGVELSFSTVKPGAKAQLGGYRIFVSGSTQGRTIDNGDTSLITTINGSKSMAGKVTVTATSQGNERFIGEMMYVTQGNTGGTPKVGTTVRVAETGGDLGAGAGMMLEADTSQGPFDHFDVKVKNNTGASITLNGVRVLIEHFDA